MNRERDLFDRAIDNARPGARVVYAMSERGLQITLPLLDAYLSGHRWYWTAKWLLGGSNVLSD